MVSLIGADHRRSANGFYSSDRRALNPGWLSRSGYHTSPLSTIIAVDAELRLVTCHPTERCFVGSSVLGSSLTEAWSRFAKEVEAIAAVLHTIEGFSERRAFRSYGIAGDELRAVLDETGTPAGWFPLIAGYDQIPSLPQGLSVPQDLLESLVGLERSVCSAVALTDLKQRLRILYKAGAGGKLDDEEEATETQDEDGDEDEESDAAVSGARIPIPAETFLEDLSQKLEIHPISVYWLLRELREAEGVVSKPELVRFAQDYLSVLVLRLLGHQWPREIELGGTHSEWADGDGIIPLSEGTGEATLIARVRERLAADFGSERSARVEGEFQEVIGKPLIAWLASDFFKHHISQFRKRPIAWQIQSEPIASGVGRPRRGSNNSRPAFSCLIYYHKLDGDLIPKLRTHYVGPLQKGYETELRTLEAIEAPNPDQQARKIHLANWVQELKTFDERLAYVATRGFGPDDLLPRLRQFAIDDAVLALKARWLRKPSRVIESGPLKNWEKAAVETDLDPQFPLWIREAILNLNHHCSVIGPTPPDQASFATDPDSGDLASIICKEARSMARRSLELACAVWWRKFEEAVLKPLREEISEASGKIKELDDELKLAEPPISSARERDVKREIKLLKSDITALKKEIAKRSGTAQTIRRQIEGYSCPKAERWESWLANQPLYDEIASIDRRRPAPTTIAEFIAQESAYVPDINDGVRVNIAPLQRAGLLAEDVLAAKDVDVAITDRAEWRADERRWVREGKLPQPGWWKQKESELVTRDMVCWKK